MWRQKLADAVLRRSVKEQAERVLAELPDGRIATARAIRSALQASLERRAARIQEIATECAALNTILERIEGETNAEIVAWRNSLLERKGALQEERAEIEGFLAGETIRVQIERLDFTIQEMECQKSNAEFLLAIIGEIEVPESEVPSVVRCPAPAPLRVVPDKGRASTTHRVRIEGRFFLSGMIGDVGGKPLLDVDTQSMELVEATVPPGVPVGRQRLTLTNPDGKSGQLESAWLAF